MALVRDFVDELRDHLRLDEEKCFDLNLVLEEAVTNVINYAYTDGAEHTFTLDAAEKGGTLTLTLTDDGVPFDPTAAPDPDVSLPAEERPIGGLGIFLIRQLMEQVFYERRDGKNVLTMTTSCNRTTLTNL